MKFAAIHGNKRQILTIIGITLAISSASLIGVSYALDNCLIGAPTTVGGGDLHLENVEHLAQPADIIAIGDVKYVERRMVNESYTLSFDATGYSENIVNIRPYRFVTIEVEEYLFDNTGKFSKEITFRDDTGGCSIMSGKRENVQMLNEVTYDVGERALFFIDMVDAEKDTPEDYDTGFYNRAEGALHKYVLRDDGTALSMAMERYGVEPVRVSDIRLILSDRILTTPIVELEAALAAAKKDLERQLPGIVAPYKLREGEGELKDFGLQSARPDFKPLKLVYVHQNGTQFLINQNSHTIVERCDLTDQNLCYTDDRSAQDFIKGHLVYVMEVSGKVNETIEVSGRYMVDTIGGKILYPPSG